MAKWYSISKSKGYRENELFQPEWHCPALLHPAELLCNAI
jgi:hypothetical protein